MHISEFDFELPAELIAQEPLAERDQSRMLIVDRAARSWRDASFRELPQVLNPGDAIVLNNTRVFPARLLGNRIIAGAPGARVEFLLVRPTKSDRTEWLVIAKPGRALKPGAEVIFGQGQLRAVIAEVLEDGNRIVRFDSREEFDHLIDEIGNTPLPPYIKREQDESHRLHEPRYQTIYAKERGAIAAPTAGLHFTPRIFEELKSREISIIEITHHVGYATFQPVRVDRIEDHSIAAEQYEITSDAAAALKQCRARGNRIVAVGTTTTRALESAADPDGIISPDKRSTELFIHPGYRFRAIDALLTNFHLPRSSLMMLVSAFVGTDADSAVRFLLSAYRHAIDQRYRFYSYGDCMFVV